MPLNFRRAAFCLSFLLVALTVQGQVMPNATPDRHALGARLKSSRTRSR